jgi:hypothetical protein
MTNKERELMNSISGSEENTKQALNPVLLFKTAVVFKKMCRVCKHRSMTWSGHGEKILEEKLCVKCRKLWRDKMKELEE